MDMPIERLVSAPAARAKRWWAVPDSVRVAMKSPTKTLGSPVESNSATTVLPLMLKHLSLCTSDAS
eukprot:7836-Heterococcus_DN1.PRE.5